MSGEGVVSTKHGVAVKTRAMLLGTLERGHTKATPWSPDGSDNPYAVLVHMERPAEIVPLPPSDVLM